MSKLKTALRLIKTPLRLLLPLGRNGWLRWIPDQTYLKLIYRGETGQKLHLDNPVTFSEKIQWLKLHDRNPEYISLVDKYRMKAIAAERIGPEYVIPVLSVWEKAEDIDFSALPDQFVLKCNHDSGGVVVCRDKNQIDQKKLVAFFQKHLQHDAYIPGREWPYKNVKRVVFAEKLLENPAGGELIDYKFYCFHGEPVYCQVIKNRLTCETIDFYDHNWELQPFTGLRFGVPHGEITAKPPHLDKMWDIAREFAKGTVFVRIDLYNCNGKIYFGEFTLYPKSGFGTFRPEEWNKRLGDQIVLSTIEKRRKSKG